jgi:hypothetical protein
MRHAALSIALLNLAIALPATASGTVHVVNPDGSGDFATIQAAINASTHGDTILLTDGIFTGEGNRDLNYWGRAITICSESGDPESCVIDCQGDDASPHRGCRFCFGEGPGSRLQAVTIRNGYAHDYGSGRGGALEICSGSSPTISNCVFADNQATWGGAISCLDHCSPDIIACIFSRNFARYSAGAIDLVDQCLPVISYCTFWANQTPGYSAALNCEYSLPIVENCTFVMNVCLHSAAIGVFAASGLIMDNSIVAFTNTGMGIICEDGNAYLTCCDVFGNDHGDWVGCIADQIGVEGNICLDPLFCDAHDGDFSISCASPCAPSSPPNQDCELIGAFTIGCGGTPVVQTTWGDIKAMFRP